MKYYRAFRKTFGRYGFETGHNDEFTLIDYGDQLTQLTYEKFNAMRKTANITITPAFFDKL